jgi:hypothetical protein
MRTVEHDDRYYVDLQPFDKLKDALLYAGLLQFNGERRSIPIYRNGKIVRHKRF